MQSKYYVKVFVIVGYTFHRLYFFHGTIHTIHRHQYGKLGRYCRPTSSTKWAKRSV